MSTSTSKTRPSYPSTSTSDGMSSSSSSSSSTVIMIPTSSSSSIDVITNQSNDSSASSSSSTIVEIESTTSTASSVHLISFPRTSIVSSSSSSSSTSSSLSTHPTDINASSSSSHPSDTTTTTLPRKERRLPFPIVKKTRSAETSSETDLSHVQTERRAHLLKRMTLKKAAKARDVRKQHQQLLANVKRSRKPPTARIVEKALESTPFDFIGGGDGSRRARFGHDAFTLGVVRNYSQGLFVSANSVLFPELTRLLTWFAEGVDPTLAFSSIHINRNFPGEVHVDRFNDGPSLMFACGDYCGGELFIQCPKPKQGIAHFYPRGKPDPDAREIDGGNDDEMPGFRLPTKRRWLRFDGNCAHGTFPYCTTNARYSIVYFN